MNASFRISRLNLLLDRTALTIADNNIHSAGRYGFHTWKKCEGYLGQFMKNLLSLPLFNFYAHVIVRLQFCISLRHSREDTKQRCAIT